MVTCVCAQICSKQSTAPAKKKPIVAVYFTTLVIVIVSRKNQLEGHLMFLKKLLAAAEF